MGGGMGGGRHGEGGGDESDSGSRPSGPSYDSQRFGAARFSYINTPEPLTSADTDMNRSITAAEFAASANRRFAMLAGEDNDFIEKKNLPPLPEGGRRR